MESARTPQVEAPEEEYDADIPVEFLCPILKVIMIDPVVTVKGQTYERANIVNWFKTKNKEPIGGQILTDREKKHFNS